MSVPNFEQKLEDSVFLLISGSSKLIYNLLSC